MSRGRLAPIPCQFLGKPTGDNEIKFNCQADPPRRINLFACDIHGTCTTHERARGTACCKDCRQRVGKTVAEAVSLDQGGIGDTLCAIAAATGLGPGVEFVPPWNRRQWAELFIDLAEEGIPIVREHKLILADYGRTDRSKSPRWEWFADQLGVELQLPKLKPLPADVENWAMAYAGRVVLSPFSAHENRCWPLENWIEVASILINRSLLVVVLDDQPGRCEGFLSDQPVPSDPPAVIRNRCDLMVSAPPPQVAAIMVNAAGFAGNDSGMAHLAGAIGVQGVCVSAAISDARIMGCYPSITELGGRGVGWDDITPTMVADELCRRIEANRGTFPLAEFAANVLPKDQWRLNAWVQVYRSLWDTVRELQPRSIVEIGCRAGYSAWTFLSALPDATVHSIDANLNEHGGFVGAMRHAETYLPRDRWTLQEANSHDLTSLPACDMVYVDGDHSEMGCYRDLQLALTAKPKWILVDDVVNCHTSVKPACDRFAAEKGLVPRFIPSQTGVYVFTFEGVE